MEIGTIINEGELKLMLLKHWTLNDSINNSNYLIAKLKLTKDPAQNKYKELLAGIKVPLDQALQ